MNERAQSSQPDESRARISTSASALNTCADPQWFLFMAIVSLPALFNLFFPAEIMCGLAFCCAWFYVRNLLGLLWPATYEITELTALKYVAFAIQLLHAWFSIRGNARISIAQFVRRNAAALTVFTLFAY